MSDQTCRCGKPTRDAAYVCDQCGHDLSVALGEVPWIETEIEVTITRQKGVDYRTKGGTAASERPSPVVWGASEARTHLKALLVSWAKFCHEDGVRNQSPVDGLPADNLTALSRWLMWRVDGLALLDIGPDAVDEITSAVAHCRRLVDRPADRQYLGECKVCHAVGDDGALYGRPGSSLATCDNCGDAIDAEQLRAALLASLDDRLCTAAEIARLSTYLGLKADRNRVRQRINQWHKRGRIGSESMLEEPAFRFGTVYAMLVADDYDTGKKTA
jgi:hypothetical protein